MNTKENYHQLLVGDVPIGLITNIPFHDTPPEFFFETTEVEPEVFLFMMKKDKPGLGYVNYPDKIWLGMDEDGIEKYRFQGFYLRMFGALLAGAHSKELNAVHAAGSYIAPIEKSALFLGPGGSGKTSFSMIFDDRLDVAKHVSRKFCSGHTLDDDLLFIDDWAMYTIGKRGGMTYKDDLGKIINYRIPVSSMEPLDAIFILEKGLPGGTLIETSRTIKRSIMAFDNVPPEIVRPILDLPPYQAKVPVFNLGTDGNFRAAIGCIEDAFYR